MSNFLKFPRTPHLFVMSGLNVRDDKVLSSEERSLFYANPIILEEKTDGANVGISFSSNGELRVQNRGNYIIPGFAPQFDKIWPWLSKRTEQLHETLKDRFVLFGEWCYAKHSIHYTKLPDWFLAFDIYDRQENQFLTVERRNAMLGNINIAVIQMVGNGIFAQNQLVKLLKKQPSTYCEGKMEGLYLRLEDERFLKLRAKVVQANFIQSISNHWSREKLVENRLLNLKEQTR